MPRSKKNVQFWPWVFKNSKYRNEKQLSTKTKPEAGKQKNGQFEDTKLTKKVQKKNGE